MSIECCGIACIGDSICEVEDGRISLRVRIEEVKRIVLGYGFQSPHPILQTILALMLITVGLFAAYDFFEAMVGGGAFRKVGGKLEGGLIAFGLIGVWLLAKVVNRGFYLDVFCSTGRRRLGFDDTGSREKVRDFLGALATAVQVPVTSRVMGIPNPD